MRRSFVDIGGGCELRGEIAMQSSPIADTEGVVARAPVYDRRVMIELDSLESCARVQRSSGDAFIFVLQLKITMEQQAVDRDQVVRFITSNRPGSYNQKTGTWNELQSRHEPDQHEDETKK